VGTNRRDFLATGAALLVSSQAHSKRPPAASVPMVFPEGFLWGAATAGHQVEGNNVASDAWLLEHVRRSTFKEPSGDACNSFALWQEDLDLVRALGLNTYRFSLEWARIEPERGLISLAILEHYKRIIAGCRERGLIPMVTFNHYTCPRWFAARGGWTDPQAADLFVAYCETAARHLAAEIGYATTLNEPNAPRQLKWYDMPASFYDAQDRMLEAARQACGSPHFTAANAANNADLEAMLPVMTVAHKRAYEAIKSVRPDLPVGVSLAIGDDQAVGTNTRRDQMRSDAYGAWLEAVKAGDFLGVQNYFRTQSDVHGLLPVPKGAKTNSMGDEIYPASLGNAVRYAHEATGLPIIVTENGLAADDDNLRAAYIPEALHGLHAALRDGVPVKGYVHWSLLDNYEWTSGYSQKFGLCAVDRTTFQRVRKPSAAVLEAIARRNAL
jgi:beta-glucosidase